MRIAILKNEVSYTKGGAERYAANLCRSLAEAGHEVLVLAEKFDSRIHPALVHVPVRVDRSTSWSRNLSFHRNCQTALGGLDTDAVFALSRSYPADAFRVSDPLHRFWMKVRYPGKIHRFLQTLNPRHRAILGLERGIFNPVMTRMIVTNSELSKKLIREYYDYPEDRIHVVYNGVDLDRFSPDPDKETDPSGIVRLLFVGQDFKRKGLSSVVRALARVRESGFVCRLRVIGRDDPSPYRRLAAELGVGDHVTFEGASGSVHQAYRQADLLVFPSLYDPFANVCLEALACGLPVLTTTTNGASEILTEGGDGYVVPGDSDHLSDILAGKIETFAGLSPSARSAMASAAAGKALSFTLRANADAVAALLSCQENAP